MNDETSAGSAGADAPVESVPPTAADPVAAKLTEFGVDADVISKIRDDLGVTTLEDLEVLTEADLATVGVKVVQARKLVGSLAPAVSIDSVVGTGGFLPSVPNYDSLLEMLKAGGVLKVEQSTVIAAVQASIANRAGLFGVTGKLTEAMLEYATTNEEAVDPVYYRMKQQLTQRSFGDLFASIPGFNGRSVSDRSKKDLFARIDANLWPATLEFHSVLAAWMDAWMKSTNNPAAMAAALSAFANRGSTTVMPAMGQAPDTGGLRDQAEKFYDAVNRSFAGEGIQIAAAVAFEARQIRETITDARLPSLIGAANHEQMLRQLNISVSAADPRFEANVTKFVLSIMQVKNVAGGNDELNYFNELFLLGAQIPWDQFGATSGGRISSIGGPRDL